MYLIVEEDYTISHSKILTGKIRCRCRRGEISVVDTTRMQGMNSAANQLTGSMPEWSPVNAYYLPAQEEPTK